MGKKASERGCLSSTPAVVAAATAAITNPNQGKDIPWEI